jgi:2-oxoisovalerate dehydrogenase E1 component alpha subunit
MSLPANPVSGQSSTELDGDLVRIYRTMLLTRALDERIWALAQQGRIGITGPVRGHEAAQVASAWAVHAGRDVVLPYYRDIGVVLALGVTVLDILLGALDRGDDPFSGGRQMPFHFSSTRLRMPTPSSSVATQVPHAVGAALASRLRGENVATLVYFGDGATSKADVHEGLTFAAIHRLPVVFFCENNQYAISAPLHRQMAVRSVAERATAYGMPGDRFDGNSVVEAYRATHRALERARAGGGPTLLEAVLYRLGPHTSHDDDSRYRTREEVAEWEARDPIRRLRSDLVERGLLSEEEDRSLESDARREIEEALVQAEAASPPARGTAFSDILAGHVVPDLFERVSRGSRQDTQGIYATGTHRPSSPQE